MASLADMLSGSFDAVEKAGKTPPLRSLTEALLEYALQQQHPVNDPSGKYSDLPYPGNPNFRPMDKYETPGADEVGASGLSTLTRSLYPFERNTRTGEYRGAMPKVLQNLDPVGMAKAAGDKLKTIGRHDGSAAGRQQMREDAFDLASMLTLGAGAIPRAAGSLNMGVHFRGGGKSDPTDIGWNFKDVDVGFHTRLPRWANREITQAIDAGEFLTADLPPRSIVATQTKVNSDFKQAAENRATEKPLVIKYEGKFFLRDGHHRVNAAAENGSPSVKVRLIDLDGDSQTDAPLLEYINRQ